MAFNNHTNSLLSSYGRTFKLGIPTSVPDPTDPTSTSTTYVTKDILGYAGKWSSKEIDNTLIMMDSIRLVIGPEDQNGAIIEPSLSDKILDGDITYNITYKRPIYVGERIETWVLALSR